MEIQESSNPCKSKKLFKSKGYFNTNLYLTFFILNVIKKCRSRYYDVKIIIKENLLKH